MNLRPPGYEQSRVGAKGQDKPRKGVVSFSRPPTRGRPALENHNQKAFAPIPNRQRSPREPPKYGGKSPKATGHKREMRSSKTPSQGRAKAQFVLKNPKTPHKITVGGKRENRRFFVKIPTRKGKGKRPSKMPSGSFVPKGHLVFLLTHSGGQLGKSLHLMLVKSTYIQIGVVD